MTDDGAKYTFKIENVTPETLPFGRLIEYYSEIKNMLGNADSLFLVEISKGSHENCFKVSNLHKADIDQRLSAVRDRTAPQRAMRAFQTINSMLSHDSASGSFANQAKTNIIQFPGRDDDVSGAIRINDVATFRGELYHISGSKEDVRVRIQTDPYGVVFCTTTRDIAKTLRDFLFEEVRVSGRGEWVKLNGGNWVVDNFSITDFTPVLKEPVRDAVNRIRSIDLDWPLDPIGEIRALGGKGDQVQ